MEKKFDLKRIVIIVVTLLFVGLLSYKLAMFLKYKTENIPINTESIFNDTLNISYTEDNDIATFDEMSYHNYFSEYVDKEGLDFKVKYDDNGEIVSFYNIAKDELLINMLSVDSFEMATDIEDINNRKYSTEKNMKRFLDKNNINDDIELIRYIKDNYYLKNDLLTPTKTMRNNYIINSLAQSAFPNFENITLIEGDKIKGYIINVQANPLKAIHLIHGNNQYIIALYGEEVTNSKFVNDLLESISFN